MATKYDKNKYSTESTFEYKGIDPDTGLHRFIATDERIDRDGDIMRAAGADLKNFKSNPVILFQHGRGPAGMVPIGKAGYVKKIPADKNIEIGIEFVPKDIFPFAGMIEEMVINKFINTGSIRFIPRESKSMIGDGGSGYPEGYSGPTWGREFKKWEMIEYSMVAIPSNVGAIQRSMKSMDEYEVAMQAGCKGDIDSWLKGEYVKGSKDSHECGCGKCGHECNHHDEEPRIPAVDDAGKAVEVLQERIKEQEEEIKGLKTRVPQTLKEFLDAMVIKDNQTIEEFMN